MTSVGKTYRLIGSAYYSVDPNAPDGNYKLYVQCTPMNNVCISTFLVIKFSVFVTKKISPN